MLPPWARWDGERLVVTLRVQPRASRDALQPDAARLRVRITAPPVDGAANAHLLRFLADGFGVSASQVTLLHGASGREKVVRIERPREVPQALSGYLDRP